MATLTELLIIIQSGKATAEDYEALAKLSNETATAKKKIESQASTLIAEIKKAKIDPQILTNLLEKEGLIILPELPKPEDKTPIHETPTTTKAGRSSSFKIWKGRDVSKLTGVALENWQMVKGKGKQNFIDTLTNEGKAFYDTEDGKKYIDKIFM